MWIIKYKTIFSMCEILKICHENVCYWVKIEFSAGKRVFNTFTHVWVSVRQVNGCMYGSSRIGVVEWFIKHRNSFENCKTISCLALQLCFLFLLQFINGWPMKITRTLLINSCFGFVYTTNEGTGRFRWI